MIWRILLNPQGGEGGNGGGTNEGGDKGGDKAPDLAKAVEGLIAKHGDGTAALRILLGENYAYRDQLRDAKAKLPADGAVVLSGDEAKAWGTYRELGPPPELKKALEEGRLNAAEVGNFRKTAVLDEAADVTTIDGSKLKASALKKLAKDVEVVIVEEKGKDGKAVKVARVRGEGDETTPLAEYAAKHWADFLPSLKAEATARPLGTPRIERQPPPGGGTPPDRPAAPRRSVF